MTAKITVTKPFEKKRTFTDRSIIEAARALLGVPYRTQGRDRHGTDCGGLLLMVGRALGITDLEVLGYANNPDGKTFGELLEMVLEPVRPKEAARMGDILAMDYGAGIQHTGFVTEICEDSDKESGVRIKIIHAKRPRDGFGSRDRGVIEQYLHGYDERAWVETYRVRNSVETVAETDE